MDDRHINGGFLPHDRISENNHGMDENIRGDDVTMNQQATDDITVDTGQGYGITVGKGMVRQLMNSTIKAHVRVIR